MLTIGKPYVTELTDSARLNCEVSINGKNKLLFIECAKEYAPYLVHERADAFVVLLVNYAISTKQDITCESPITAELMHNLKQFLIPSIIQAGKKNGLKSYDVNIYAPIADDELPCNGGVVTTLSCGIDSLYSLKYYTEETTPKSLRLTHVYMGNCSIDVMKPNVNNLQEFIDANKPKYDKCVRVAQMAGLPFVTAFSNFLTFKDKPRPNHYEIIAEILCFRKLWGTFCFPSGYDFSEFSMTKGITKDSSYYELLTSYVMSVPNFQLICAGGGFSRLEKTRVLMDYEIAQKELETCFYSVNGRNCSKAGCSKCRRTLSALDIYDRLDDFKDVFDIEKYKAERKTFLKAVYTRRNESYFDELCVLLREKYPNEFEELAKKYPDENTETSDTAEKQETDATALAAEKRINEALLKSNHLLASIVMSQSEAVRMQVIKFFNKKGITNLYLTPRCRMGDTIDSVLQKDSDICFTYDFEEIKQADGVLILTTRPTSINWITSRVRKKREKDLKVFTIEQLLSAVLDGLK